MLKLFSALLLSLVLIGPASASTLAELKQELVATKAALTQHLDDIERITGDLSLEDLELISEQKSPTLEVEGPVTTVDVLIEAHDSMAWAEEYLNILIKETDNNLKNKK